VFGFASYPNRLPLPLNLSYDNQLYKRLYIGCSFVGGKLQQ